MDTIKEPIKELQASATAFYKSAIGVLLSVVSFFMVMTYNKLSSIDANVQSLTTSDAVNKDRIESNNIRIHSVELRQDKTDERIRYLEIQLNHKQR